VKRTPQFNGGGIGLLDEPSSAAAATVTAASEGADAGWVSRLPSAGSLGIFLALCSDSFLSHYSAPGLFVDLKPDSNSTKVTKSIKSLALAAVGGKKEGGEGGGGGGGGGGAALKGQEREGSEGAYEGAEKGDNGSASASGSADASAAATAATATAATAAAAAAVAGDRKLEAFSASVRTAFGLATALFLVIASAGFATFGTAAQANILK
jgi:hypothetical protein